MRIQWRSFPLRPTPDPTVTFKGTYREAGWRRASAQAEPEGITYRIWEREDFPTWSLPALEAAKCASFQGEAFERLHLALYEAFFSRGVNIAVREELLPIVSAAGLDMDQFHADGDSGRARDAVLRDYAAAQQEHQVRAIPTVILDRGQKIVGAVPYEEYRRTLEKLLAAQRERR